MTSTAALPTEHFDVINPFLPTSVDDLAERVGAWLAELEKNADAVLVFE